MSWLTALVVDFYAKFTGLLWSPFFYAMEYYQQLINDYVQLRDLHGQG